MFEKRDFIILAAIAGVFIALYFLPVGNLRFDGAIMESLHLAKWYAREHVLLCLIPAFYIAGAIGIFVSQSSVMRYLGPRANKFLAYGVASVSGTILAVCSCTVLPLFAGIYTTGAGLGPAIAFLYSGPAINVLAIVLTARILGLSLGAARAIGAIMFSVVIGLAMHFIFHKTEREKNDAFVVTDENKPHRPLWKNALFFASMVGILVFANWGKPTSAEGFWFTVFSAKWIITAAFAVLLGIILCAWFELSILKLAVIGIPTAFFALILPDSPTLAFAIGTIIFSIIVATSKGELFDWFCASWGFAKQIFPLLLGGVLVSGFLLGRPGYEGIIPSEWVYRSVGGNGFLANLFASVAGALMYFATLTEVPILQGLIGNGMGQGPALALLLAGPALSLPNMLVIRSIIGTKKTLVFIGLVVIMATLTGFIYGEFTH